MNLISYKGWGIDISAVFNVKIPALLFLVVLINFLELYTLINHVFQSFYHILMFNAQSKNKDVLDYFFSTVSLNNFISM
jgi:hypothetical protein